jgi:hypothetical protein
MNRSLLDYRPSIAALEQLTVSDGDVPLDDELRLAAELLEHSDAGELEVYVGKLVDRSASRVPGHVRQALVEALARIGKPLLRQTDATPRAAAGRVFGLELEGLSPEDQAFEVARHFARFATDAARRSGRAAGTGSPRAVAARAVEAAANRFAPGLRAGRAHVRRPAGTWIRRGRQLIVFNP